MRTYLPIVWMAVGWLGCQVSEGPEQVVGANSNTTQIRNPSDAGAAADAARSDVSGTDGSADGAAGAPVVPFMPPPSWQEHWIDHDQILKKASETEDTAIYFDADVGQASASWIQPFVTSLWKYTKQTFGTPGDGRLYAVFHAGRYEGWHTASIFDPTHDHRGVIDIGSADKAFWMMLQQPSRVAYPIGDLMEKSAFGYDTLPSRGITEQQFIYFFAYDALKAVGMSADAEAWLGSLMTYSVDFPRPSTFWSRDWFYPLWLNYGGIGVFTRFVHLVVDKYPKIPRPDGQGQTFALVMNWGEYVHFMSGAASTDLRAMATRAFGWPDSNQTEYQQAKLDFPSIKY